MSADRTTAHANPARWELTAVLLAALALRAAAIFLLPSENFPDEIFQVFEQAHRIAFGYGIVPWEFVDGIRSYVPVYAFAGLFSAVSTISDRPEAYIGVARIALALTSLMPVAAVYAYARQFGRDHARIAGLFMAVWFEVVYFSIRPLSEAMAFDFLIPAFCLLQMPEGKRPALRQAIIGFALAAAFFFRFQLAPAILLGALLGLRKGRISPLIAGAALPTLLFGWVDTITWGAPFHFIYANFLTNLVHNKASSFGTMPLAQYPAFLMSYWAGALWPMLALILWRAKAYRVWLAAALLILISHSLIPHKEYRFVFSAFAMLGLVAALASVDFTKTLASLWQVTEPRQWMSMLASFWCVTSVTLSFAPGFNKQWTAFTPILRQNLWLYDQKDLCGLGYYDKNIFFTGGYTYLHRPVPMYAVNRPGGGEGEYIKKFNYIIFEARYIYEIDNSFKLLRCRKADDQTDFDALCIARRPGPCLPHAAPDLPAFTGH